MTMTRRTLASDIRWTIPAAVLLAATFAGCTQRSADDIERSAGPTRRPLRAESPVAAAPALIPAAPSTRPADAAGRRVITRLVGRDKVVEITHGPAGPLYSATNRSGDVLVAGATLDEVRDRAPDVYRFLFPSVTKHGTEAKAGGAPDVTAEAWSGR
jgi:hypothetical protein